MSEYGGFISRSHGTWEEQSASVEGSLLDQSIGSSLPGLSASMGRNHQNTITIERGQ